MTSFRIDKKNVKRWDRVLGGLKKTETNEYWARHVLDLEDLGNLTLKYVHNFFKEKRQDETLWQFKQQGLQGRVRRFKIMEGYWVTFLKFRPKHGGRNFLTANVKGPGVTITHRKAASDPTIARNLRVMDEGYLTGWTAFAKNAKKMMVIPLDDPGSEKGYKLIRTRIVEHEKGEGATKFLTHASNYMQREWDKRRIMAGEKAWDIVEKPNLTF